MSCPVSYFFSWCIYLYALKKIVSFYPLHRIGKYLRLGFPGGSDGQESACNAGDLGLISGLRRSPGERNGYQLWYSCLGDPWTEEPGGLQSMGLQRVGHDWVTNTHTHTHTCMHTLGRWCSGTRATGEQDGLSEYSFQAGEMQTSRHKELPKTTVW